MKVLYVIHIISSFYWLIYRRVTKKKIQQKVRSFNIFLSKSIILLQLIPTTKTKKRQKIIFITATVLLVGFALKILIQNKNLVFIP